MEHWTQTHEQEGKRETRLHLRAETASEGMTLGMMIADLRVEGVRLNWDEDDASASFPLLVKASQTTLSPGPIYITPEGDLVQRKTPANSEPSLAERAASAVSYIDKRRQTLEGWKRGQLMQRAKALGLFLPMHRSKVVSLTREKLIDIILNDEKTQHIITTTGKD